MENGNQFQQLAPDAIGNDVMRVRHDKFSRSSQPARPSHVRLHLKQIDRMENSLCNQRGILFRVFCNMVAKCDEVPDRPPLTRAIKS
jgi:hypothetical protein